MDYKQKYEQALKRAKKLQADAKGLILNKWLYGVFPELKKSEDEMIKEEIKVILANTDLSQFALNYTFADMVTWLQKQGEQKPEIKYIYPKFRVGDVIEPAKPNGHYVPVRVKYIGEGVYSCESDDHKAFLSLPICNENDYVLTEQKPAWSEEDKKTIDRIYNFLWKNRKGDTSEIYQQEKDANWLKSLKDRIKGE